MFSIELPISSSTARTLSRQAKTWASTPTVRHDPSSVLCGVMPERKAMLPTTMPAAYLGVPGCTLGWICSTPPILNG